MDSKEYHEYYQNHFSKLEELLELLKNKQYSVVLWGAGLKGQAFLEICDSENIYVQSVIDRDSRKQGKVLSSGHVVRQISDVNSNMVVLVANEKYYASVCFSLFDHGYDVKKIKLLCLDWFVADRFTLEDVRSGKIWERKRYYD
ncbi:MAG: hypothetical protein HFH72_03060 [Lachnospiraceae bacterium]|nr:hypothetical protein [Lachnospiraceae bacterium]